ncbi:MAG: phosphoribulokinase [Cellvibrionales bacterium]|nr:phosphoribulokinase [Cellvibrionales bacterium]
MDFIDKFIRQHQLPEEFRDKALRWYKPMAEAISLAHDKRCKPLLIGLNGCQGSGKSTAAELVAEFLTLYYDKSAVSFSLDDFYLPKAERQALASRVNPLFTTRGVPGTHDMPLLLNTLRQLKGGESTSVPSFDKAIDDRDFPEHWRAINSPMDIIILEGWCVGIEAQLDTSLISPTNALEASEDPDGHWRGYVNQQLKGDYQQLNNRIDLLIMLKAPSFQYVYEWRLEQEQKLRQYLSDNHLDATAMTDAQVEHFTQFFQRITEHGLKTLPDKVDLLFNLDENRVIYEMAYPKGVIQ